MAVSETGSLDSEERLSPEAQGVITDFKDLAEVVQRRTLGFINKRSGWLDGRGHFVVNGFNRLSPEDQGRVIAEFRRIAKEPAQTIAAASKAEGTQGNGFPDTYPESSGADLVPAKRKLVSTRVRGALDGDEAAGRY